MAVPLIRGRRRRGARRKGLLRARRRESGNWFLHSPRPGCSYSLPPVLTLFQFLLPVLLILAALPQHPAAAQADAGAVKQVLVLYGERLDLPAIRDVELGVRETFSASESPRVEWYAEHFDFARFPSEAHHAVLSRYLQDRYAGRKLDLVLAVSSQTLSFVLKYRPQCFPGVPVVFAVRTNEAMDTGNLPPDVTGLALQLDLKGSIDLALALQPDAKKMVVVAGAGESATLAYAAGVLNQYAGRIQWRQITDLPKEDLITQALQAGQGEILLLLSAMKDSRGRAMSANELARRLAADSRAPVYGVGAGVFDTGAVGGALTDFKGAGRRVAAMALRVMAGEKVPVDPDASRSLTPLTVDWRALRHWKLSESRIPEGAVVMFREPTLWEDHRGAILAVCAVLAVQTALIAGLITQRVRRRKSEREAEKLRHELVHAGRVTLLGQLAVSLAHELNQPLDSILRNAEAAELFLQNETPDLDELRPIVADILTDDQRARGVIDRLRAFLKRGDPQPQPLPPGEVVEEVIILTRSDALARRVTIELEAAKDLPKVLCDRVQLQQVILNLLLNGMDACAQATAGERRVVIGILREEGAHQLEITVRDNGPGIPHDKRDRVFEPFFSTKPQGLGMGLPISRAIIESHGGRMWVDNNDGSGAVFRFTLPVAEEGEP